MRRPIKKYPEHSNNSKYLVFFGILLVLAIGFSWFLYGSKSETKTNSALHQPITEIPEKKNTEQIVEEKKKPAEIKFVGPRENVPEDTPKALGFWSFAILDEGRISRSGQPTIEEYQWLKEKGWKSVINLREDIDRGENGDDEKIPGFKELGFNYLHLPIPDGSPPTKEQAEEFLAFVAKPENLPTHIHCRGGIGRTGAMVALYRYTYNLWPMDKAIEESRAFRGGVSSGQEKFLKQWAKDHPQNNEMKSITLLWHYKNLLEKNVYAERKN